MERHVMRAQRKVINKTTSVIIKRNNRFKDNAIFITFIDKHFHKESLFYPIFNRSTVKISHCCMPNVKKIMQSHNKRTLEKYNRSEIDVRRPCNCRDKTACPLSGECLTENIIYEAEVTTSKTTKLYIGSTGNSFKSRYTSHVHSFNHKGKNETELSKYIWSLKDNNTAYRLKWKILRRMPTGKQSALKICRTCNEEKQAIVMAEKRSPLNRRSELNSMCPHFRKLYFGRIPSVKMKKNYTPKPPT